MKTNTSNAIYYRIKNTAKLKLIAGDFKNVLATRNSAQIWPTLERKDHFSTKPCFIKRTGSNFSLSQGEVFSHSSRSAHESQAEYQTSFNAGSDTTGLSNILLGKHFYNIRFTRTQGAYINGDKANIYTLEFKMNNYVYELYLSKEATATNFNIVNRKGEKLK